MQQAQPQIAKKPRPLEYVSVTLSKNDILDVLETAFASVSSNKARFYRSLQQTRRVQPEFHVTLIHRASSKAHPELWQRYADMHSNAGGDPWSAGSKMGDCKVLLERVSYSSKARYGFYSNLVFRLYGTIVLWL
jgi:tRNA ligase